MSPARKRGNKPAKKTSARGRASKKTSSRSTSKAGSARKKTTKKKTSTKKTSARKTSAQKTAAGKAVRKTTARSSPKTTGRAAARGSQVQADRKKTTQRRTRPPKLTKEILKGIRARLEKDLTDLREQLEELEEDSSPDPDEGGLNEDFADAGTSTFDRERDLSIRYNVEDLIDQVRRAVARIDEGTYGTCENCGRPIDAARIKAFPRVLMCLDCKRRDERAR